MNNIQDKEWLYDQYVIQRKSIRKIAKENNCGSSTVSRYLIKHGVSSRNVSEAKLGDSLNLLTDYEWLYDQYVIQRKTPETIAKENNVGRATIVRYLTKHNIHLRNVSEAKLGDSLNLLTDYEWLYNNYVIKYRTLESICQELSCSSTALIKYLDSHGIERRGVVESITEESKDKMKQTMLERYGVKNPAQKHLTDILPLINDYEWLYEQYITNNKSAHQIAQELNICIYTIYNYLELHEIELKYIVGYSIKAIQWLESIIDKEGIFIQHAGNTGEFKIPKTRYKADGYCEETNTIYEFHGDIFHGNPDLFEDTDKPNFYQPEVTALELYTKTKEREREIISLGYNLITIWENDFNKL